MDTLQFAVVVSFLAGTAASALAADILVPQDEPNLKNALLSAAPGDRVIVNGGTWRNGRVVSGIQLIGRNGATLSGLWEIQGAGATVEGFAVRDGSMEVEADDVAIRLNRFSGPKYSLMLTGTGVSRLSIAGNRFNNATAQIEDATDVLARNNRFSFGELIVLGTGSTVEQNVFVKKAQLGVHDGANATVRENTGGSIYLWNMTDASVTDNTIRRGVLSVRGDRAIITGNEMKAGLGLSVEGDDATVRSNRIGVLHGGLSVKGAHAIVTDNMVDNRASQLRHIDRGGILVVNGAGPASVLRNEVSLVKSTGAVIRCDEAEVASNTIRSEQGAQVLIVEGSRNSVHDNALHVTHPGDDLASTLVVAGDENVVTDTTVDGAGYDGVSVNGSGNLVARIHVASAGRCGITVADAGAGTGVADCTVDSARWASLFVLGTDTTVTGGTFTGGRKVDVLDLGTGTEFVSSTFATKSEDEGMRPYR